MTPASWSSEGRRPGRQIRVGHAKAAQRGPQVREARRSTALRRARGRREAAPRAAGALPLAVVGLAFFAVAGSARSGDFGRLEVVALPRRSGRASLFPSSGSAG